MNEGEYLELVKQLQDKFDKNEKKVKEVRENMYSLIKEVVTIYGMFRMIDRLIEYEDEIDGEIKILCSTLRLHLSELYDEIVSPKLIVICKDCKDGQEASEN
jgi:hypothetical protein